MLGRLVSSAAHRGVSDSDIAELAVLSPTSSGGSSGALDFAATMSSGGGSMAGGSWDGLLQNLRRNGLDIVITFDSTGSMGGEIEQVKEQIEQMSTHIAHLEQERIALEKTLTETRSETELNEVRTIVEERERVLGPHDPATISAMLILGRRPKGLGHFDEAEQVLSRAIANARGVLAEDDVRLVHLLRAHGATSSTGRSCAAPILTSCSSVLTTMRT